MRSVRSAGEYVRRRGVIRSLRLIAIDPSCRRETACAPSRSDRRQDLLRDRFQLGVLWEDAVIDEPPLGHERHRPFSVAADEERAVVHDERAERVHQDPGKQEEREEHVSTPHDCRDRHRLPQSPLAPRRITSFAATSVARTMPVISTPYPVSGASNTAPAAIGPYALVARYSGRS